MTDTSTKDTEINQRRHIRKRLSCTANVFQTQSGLSVGRIFDISQEGFMLLGPTQMQPNEVINLTLELPELDSTRSIELAAECMWCQPSNFTRDFGAGFHIKTISDQDQVALNYFIRDF
ncbi:PilZ domain-containing protein [Sansalvadorimonas verongulae]|uniref:PilZ domain-containing protein n=1 Tax=Sansalvadorimonas verongulae TaxID=2172824 RepID=UPI0012BCB6B8|nr:PilZ domain-containing protein [Sansalvadorimonas verongulae]MTI13572.1 PilZ domain-containing protein [Sansalvadorimonas verongulae]